MPTATKDKPAPKTSEPKQAKTTDGKDSGLTAEQVQQGEQDQIRNALKSANMSESSELTAEQRHRALAHPAGMKGDRLRAHIMGNGEAKKPADGEQTRFSRFPEHDEIAKKATAMLRTNAPQRAACSTRAVGATLEHVGRKDWQKMLGGISVKQATELAKGEIKLAGLDDDKKKAVKQHVEAIRKASGLVRFDARVMLAVLVAAKGR